MLRQESVWYQGGFRRELFKSWSVEQRATFLQSLSDDEVVNLDRDWRVWARENQMAPNVGWSTWFILTGRGFGKTRTAVENILDDVDEGRAGRICLLGQGADDVRNVMIEGVSGFLARAKPWNRPRWSPSRGGGMLEWPNGALGYVYSSEDPDALRGPEFDLAWIDEIMAFKADARAKAESNLRFGLRLGKHPRRIYTTTPRPHKWLREFMAKLAGQDSSEIAPRSLWYPKRRVVMTNGHTLDNAENLPETFLEGIMDDYDGTLLGRQELAGEIVNEGDDALWTPDMLDEGRKTATPPGFQDNYQDARRFAAGCDRVIVGLDPNMTQGRASHAAGIVVCGIDGDKRYLIWDGTLRGAHPIRWATRAINLYQDFMADEIVAEVNQGGDMVSSLIYQVAETMQLQRPVKVKQVRAQKGKQRRAEPVAADYQSGKIYHVGSATKFKLIEQQMCDLHEGFDSTGEDFDRVDALVWAMTRLRKRRFGTSSLVLPGGFMRMRDFSDGRQADSDF